jgi:hypothetical protein
LKPRRWPPAAARLRISAASATRSVPTGSLGLLTPSAADSRNPAPHVPDQGVSRIPRAEPTSGQVALEYTLDIRLTSSALANIVGPDSAAQVGLPPAKGGHGVSQGRIRRSPKTSGARGLRAGNSKVVPRAGALVAALSVICSVVLAGPPGALASCQPERGGTHDTVARYDITTAGISSLTGISSSITEYDPYYSGSNSTGTNATDMMVQWSPSTRWAQLGWFKSKIDGGVTKRESGLEFYLSGSQNYFEWFGSKSIGHSTWYEILYEAPSTFNFFIDGSHVATYTGTLTPAEYQVFGETHDWVDQMPGGTGTHVVFNNTNYFTGSGHTAHLSTSSITSDWTRYGHSGPSSGKYQIWEAVCSS